MEDTITLQLHGTVPLPLYKLTVNRFETLIDRISVEVVGADSAQGMAEKEIEWEMSSTFGEASFSVRGLSDDLSAVERAVRAYDEIGASLELNEEIVAFSPWVAQAGYKLVSSLNGQITSMTFGDSSGPSHVVTAKAKHLAKVDLPTKSYLSWGTLRGEVGAIAKRPHQQFTLYDSLFDRPVACHFTEEGLDTIREIWGKRVAVTGQVRRRIDSDRPIIVREIKHIEVLAPPGNMERVRGILPWSPDNEPSGLVIRRLRDAW